MRFSGSRVQTELITSFYVKLKYRSNNMGMLDRLINVTLLHCNGSTITRVPFDVLSTELSMAFSPSNQYNVYNFYSGVNFCRKRICGNFILRELIFADREENRKHRKN